MVVGNTLKDRIGNEDNRRKDGVANIEEKRRENRLRQFGDVKQRLEDASVRKVKVWDHGDFRRSRERPKITWVEGAKISIKGMEEEDHG